MKDCFFGTPIGTKHKCCFYTPFKTPINYQQYVKQGSFKKFKMTYQKDNRKYQIDYTKLTILLPFDVHQMRISHYTV